MTRIQITITHANGATEPRSFGTVAELNAFATDCTKGRLGSVAFWRYAVTTTEPTERPMPPRDDPQFDKKNTRRQILNSIDGGTHPQGRPFTPKELESWSARADELEREIAGTTLTTEPTEQGNQYVIPGCERDKSRGPKQIDLF